MLRREKEQTADMAFVKMSCVRRPERVLRLFSHHRGSYCEFRIRILFIGLLEATAVGN
jgi:hypothetical protein